MIRQPEPSSGDTRTSIRWLVGALVAALMLAHAAPFFVTFIEADFARDLDAALAIAQAHRLPTEGPIIAATVHLGPAWYYALAIAIAVGGSLTAAVASVALVSALQFPLAARLGSQAFDRRVGLAWAVLLALPGVGSLPSLWIAHPSVTATLVVATLLASWRAHAGGSGAWLALAGLGYGLAIHAHPTALPLGLAVAVVAIERIRADRRRGTIAAAAALLLAAAPFAPLLADPPRHVAAFAAIGASVSADASSFGVDAWGAVLVNALWRVPGLVVGTWLGSDGHAPAIWRVSLAAIYTAAAAGVVAVALRGPARRRRAIGSAVVAFVAWLAFVTAVRGETRFYMLYAAMPVAALALTLGLDGLATHAGRAGRVAAASVLTIAFAWSVALGVARVARALADDVRLPPILGAHVDLQRSVEHPPSRLRLLSVRDLDAIGKRLCVDGVTHLYGDLAQVVDSQFNVAARMRCGEASRVVIGGTPGPGDRAMFLLPREMLEPRAALREFGGFGLGRVASIQVPGAPIGLARGDVYPARVLCGPPATHELAFATANAGTLVVANGLPITCPMRVVSLSRDGGAVPWQASGDSTWTRAPHASSRWSLVVETAAPHAVQVFTVAAPRDGAPGAAR